MYTVAKGPSKQAVEKARRGGLNQKIENQRDFQKKNNDCEEPSEMSSPKPVFHQVNGKRSNSQRSSQETITPHHEEIIKFIYETWSRVCKEHEMNKQSSFDNRVPSVAYYQDKTPNPQLQNFKPFDLDSWWGQRLYQKLTQ